MIRRNRLKIGLLLLYLASVCAGGKLQYGDNCVSKPNPDDESSLDAMCNEKETLACFNGTCLCSNMMDMSFDHVRGLCVGLAGQACVHHESESHLPHIRRSHCVPYANCDNKTCSCWSAFYADDTGHCTRRRGYMQQCRMDDHCDERKGFICKDGLCQCEPKSSAYNAEQERCQGLPEQPCVNMYMECIENYKCKVGICACKYKEVTGTDGKLKCDPVKHKYGKNCGKHRGACGSDLTCINGKCRCPNPDYQVYDYEQRGCVSLIGGPCTVLAPPTTALILEEDPVDESGRLGMRQKNKIKKNENSTVSSSYLEDVTNAYGLSTNPKMATCIPYARCLPYSPHTEPIPVMGRCECDKGYIETKKGKCNLPFGAPCDTNSKNKRDMCDETVPLYCVNNACGCKNELDFYEEDTKRCKKSIGSLCWKDASCIQNARCLRYSPKLPGRCMCPPNSQLDPNTGSCILYDMETPPGYDRYEEEDDLDLDD